MFLELFLKRYLPIVILEIMLRVVQKRKRRNTKDIIKNCEKERKKLKVIIKLQGNENIINIIIFQSYLMT